MTVYLIPSGLHEDALDSIPSGVLDAVRQCRVIFAENERTARRYLKKLDKQIIIDDFEWHTISKEDQQYESVFRNKIKENKNIAIISEAGSPCIADPGQSLVAIAHQLGAHVKPLAGPISPMLALMSSGMNGQHFEFVGYLPIDALERAKAIRELETESRKRNSTKIFIETPYRNNQMLKTILENCAPETSLCIASQLTGPAESVISKPISWWRQQKTELHKIPAIFLIYAGNVKK